MLPTTMEQDEDAKEKSNKEKRREKEQRRRAQRSSLIKVRKFSFTIRACDYILSSLRSFYSRTFAPGPAFYQVFSGFLKMRITKRTKSWAVVSPCPWRYFNQEVDIFPPVIRCFHLSFSRAFILTFNVFFYQYRNSHTNLAKTQKKSKMAKRTTATRLSRENTLAWKLARESKKICLRAFH